MPLQFFKLHLVQKILTNHTVHLYFNAKELALFPFSGGIWNGQPRLMQNTITLCSNLRTSFQTKNLIKIYLKCHYLKKL